MTSIKNSPKTWMSVVAALLVLPLAASAATWTTSAQYGEYNFGNGYTVNNDCWGSGHATQTLTVDTASGSAPHFWALGNQPVGSGNVKTYPSARLNIGKTVTSLTKLLGNWSTGTSAGTYDFAFDCWIPSEVMVWTQWSGQKPNGSLYQSNVSIGGVTYNAYHGSYWSFLRTSQSSSGSADLAAIMKWLVNGGHLANGTVGSCQYGAEIVVGNGTWVVHSCSFSQ